MKAAVVGATGLVGAHVLRELSFGSPYEKIHALVRRGAPTHLSKVEVHFTDFSDPKSLASGLCVQDLFFCFGTTLKQAGSPEKFREIEWGLSSRILNEAKNQGVRRVFLVSSMGASAKSRILYSRIKGEIEDLARDLRFESTWVLRPSLLIGARQESRFFEGVFQSLTGPLSKASWGPLRNFQPIRGDRVAQKLVELCYESQPGFHLLENKDLFPSKIEIVDAPPEEVWGLRHSLLRAHQPLEKSIYPGDRVTGAIHLLARTGVRPVGIVSVSPEEPPQQFSMERPKGHSSRDDKVAAEKSNLSGGAPASMRLRGMAVVPSYRRHGVGRMLIEVLESRLRQQSITIVWFNAREVAFPFYEKLGYQYGSEMFEIEEIGPHRVMFKFL